ncbi:hypothetical protein GCM10020219_026890 [Nonomuraea dietziae]
MGGGWGGGVIRPARTVDLCDMFVGQVHAIFVFMGCRFPVENSLAVVCPVHLVRAGSLRQLVTAVSD